MNKRYPAQIELEESLNALEDEGVIVAHNRIYILDLIGELILQIEEESYNSKQEFKDDIFFCLRELIEQFEKRK